MKQSIAPEPDFAVPGRGDVTVPVDASETVDVLVIGGGVAGVCAALAAARNGCETALIEMDPVLGGNSGPLLGVHVSGAHSFHPYASETGLIEELELRAAWECAKTRSWGRHYNISYQWHLVLLHALESAGVRVFLRHQGRRAFGPARRIEAVAALDIEHFQTRLFHVRHGVIEASGDGQVAAAAGASFMWGTEGREVFGERSAPQAGSRHVMGISITALVRKTDRPVPFVLPGEFADRAAAEGPPAKLTARPPSWNPEADCCFLWCTESGGNRDPIRDTAEIRRELLYQLYRTWESVKNVSFIEESRNWELVWVAPKAGKRESRRFIGDYVLTQTDVEAGRRFADAVAYGGYGVDIHEPRGRGAQIIFYSIPPLWTLPYRCCYSKDFDNLWLAGRLMSVSHLALGTVRLMRTLAAAGQAAGTAAALARNRGVSAAELGTAHIEELQQTLLRQDASIPGIRNHDPADLARGAKVTASSEMRYGAERIHGWQPLDRPRGVQLWDWPERLEQVEFAVRNPTSAGAALRLRVETFSRKRLWKDPGERIPFRHIERIGSRGNRMEWGSDNTRVKFSEIADSAVHAPPGFEGWMRFCFPDPVPLPPRDEVSDEIRCNLVLDPCPGLELGVDPHFYDFALRLELPEPAAASYSVDADCHAFRLAPAPAYGEAANLVDGVNRRFSTNPVHMWLSDFDAPLPQWVTLEFPEPRLAGRVHLTFDTLERGYLDSPINCGARACGRCVRAYRVSLLSREGGAWREVVQVTDNIQRFRVHRWPAFPVRALRLTVDAVWDPARYRARVYEIRVYRD